MFFDLIVVTVGNILLFKSRRVSISPKHYLGGKIYTLEELRCGLDENLPVIFNLKLYGCNKAIRCKFGNWYPFKPEDILVTD